jgi:hypothetical protein
MGGLTRCVEALVTDVVSAAVARSRPKEDRQRPFSTSDKE